MEQDSWFFFSPDATNDPLLRSMATGTTKASGKTISQAINLLPQYLDGNFLCLLKEIQFLLSYLKKKVEFHKIMIRLSRFQYASHNTANH